MNNNKNFTQALALFIALALGLAVLPSLSGCSGGSETLSRVVNVFGGDKFALSDGADSQFERFHAVYREYAATDDDRQLQHFKDAYKRVRAAYVRDLADSHYINAAIKGVRDIKAKPNSVPAAEVVEAALDSMLTSLDPHSSYLNPTEYREMKISTRGEFGGLGIEVMIDKGFVKIVSPIEDTPAARAGLQPGDLITHIDGQPIKDKGLIYSVRRMRGAPGTAIQVTIRRDGVPPFDVSIIRAVIKVRSVRWRTEDNIGYIRVTSFTEKVEQGLIDAVYGIRKKLGPSLAGLVLDLRNNPGGLLDQSVIVADAFLEKGRIVTVRSRRVIEQRGYDAKKGDLASGIPIVVLINGGSASASEIVASALKDHGRAIILGRRSFGKGSVQTIAPLPIEGALRLTTALYYAPSGRTIQAYGVEPDITLTVPKKKSEIKREADLPHALVASSAPGGVWKSKPHATLNEENCAEVGAKKDRQLGCAIALLRAGSPAKFLAQARSRRPL